MKTSEDVLRKIVSDLNMEYDEVEEYLAESIPDMLKYIKDFAQMHVEEALKAVKEKGLLKFTPWDEEAWEKKEITKKDILEFYGADLPDDEEYAYSELKNRDGFTIEIDEESLENLNQII